MMSLFMILFGVDIIMYFWTIISQNAQYVVIILRAILFDTHSFLIMSQNIQFSLYTEGGCLLYGGKVIIS